MNNNRNKTKAGTDINHVKKQNATSNVNQQYAAEFASETNAQEVRQQNAASAQAQRNPNAASNVNQQYAAEFASETDVQQVKKQNAQSQARKKNSSPNQ